MKNFSLALLLVLMLNSFNVHSQTVIGKWKTIDDQTGKAKSVVEIYEKSGKIYGKIIEILNPEKRNAVCAECKGENKNVPILGLVILKGLVKEGKEYKNGTILDPNKGEEYNCYISLEDKDKLKVRGFIGLSVFGRTQFWYKVK